MRALIRKELWLFTISFTCFENCFSVYDRLTPYLQCYKFDQFVNIDTPYAQYRMRNAILRNHFAVSQSQQQRAVAVWSVDQLTAVSSAWHRRMLIQSLSHMAFSWDIGPSTLCLACSVGLLLPPPYFHSTFTFTFTFYSLTETVLPIEYTLFQNGNDFSILSFACKLALVAPFKVK